MVIALLVQLGLGFSWPKSKSGMWWCKEQGTGWGYWCASRVAGQRVLGREKTVRPAVAGLVPTHWADLTG